MPVAYLELEFLALKHESRILGQYSQTYMAISGSRKSQASSLWEESNLFHHRETTYKVG